MCYFFFIITNLVHIFDVPSIYLYCRKLKVKKKMHEVFLQIFLSQRIKT